MTELLLETQADIESDGDDAGTLEGRTLDGRYELTRRLGAGGMGVVYAARHVILGSRFAVKVLRTPPEQHKSEARERFRREARAASALGHPNIVDVKDFGELPGGLFYYVMEHLEGRDLLAEIESAPLSASRLANVGLQVAEALGAAHAKGIVHRDLKPENVFLTSRDGMPDHVKLIDFGIAKVNSGEGGRIGTVPPLAAFAMMGGPNRGRFTEAGIVLGTPAYMSPEQCKGRDVDLRSDLYALGVLLFEAATGKIPFEADSVFEMMRMHQELPAPDPRLLAPELPDEIAWLILDLMAKAPEDRPENMQAVANALLPFVPGRSRPTDVEIEAAIRSSVVIPQLRADSTPGRFEIQVPVVSAARTSSSPSQPAQRLGYAALAGAVMGLALVVGAGSVFGAAYYRRSHLAGTSLAAHGAGAVAVPSDVAVSDLPVEAISIPSAPDSSTPEAAVPAVSIARAATASEESAIISPPPAPEVTSAPARTTERRRVRSATVESAEAPAVIVAPAPAPEVRAPRPTDAVRDPWAD